jgi:hypothetical protein
LKAGSNDARIVRWEERMDCGEIRYTKHAFERMFARAIPPPSVERIVDEGRIIVTYADDAPFPSVLLLGFDEAGPIHVVVARDPGTRTCHIVTVYRPAATLWGSGFDTRRRT